ncbi:MAG: YqeG family HAD IIIA-type phosphatase [Oscillospiraceae bacterium]|jgi:HAD superfamily phosphatase (TIGR01668 family)
MSFFYPTLYLQSIACLQPAQLQRWGVRGLILDVDNTLTTHDNPVPHPEVLIWLEQMRSAGIAMIILSNNHPPRVKPFAELLGLPFTADAAKPLPKGFRRAARDLNLPKDQIAVVGDQIFTDILGGNLFGAKTVLIKPIQPESTWFFRLKRRLEKGILRKFHVKNK